MNLKDFFRDNRPEPVILKEDLTDISELNDARFVKVDMNDRFGIDAHIKSEFGYDKFQNEDSVQNGNYFGSEFNIQATVGRLVGLYAKEPWVNTCANLIARSLMQVPFKVYDSTSHKEIPKHPVQKLIDTGNFVTSKAFRDSCSYIDAVLGGNYFLIFDEKYTTCMWIPLATVTPVMREIRTDEDKRKVVELGPIESIQISDMSALKFTDGNIPFERYVQVKLPNPFNPFYGLPLIISASRPILLDRYKNEYEMAFYLRGGMHSGVIETDQEISKTRMERLMRTFEQAFTGKRNWWRQLFLPKGARWKNSTLSMTEMQHLEGLKENRATLLANLGIPPSQVGIVQDVNRSTSEDQKAALWDNTIVPLTLFIESGWNESYLVKTKYKGKIYVKADLEGLDAVEGSFYSKCELGEKAAKFMTINEIRKEILKIPPMEAGDIRGDKFVSEIVKSNPLATIGNPKDQRSDEPPPPPDVLEEKKFKKGNTDDGNGQYRHVHYCQWDDNGDGTTLGNVQGDGAQHNHVIKGWRVLSAGEDSHTHPDIIDKETYFGAKSLAKKKAVDDQANLEEVESKKYAKAVDKYLENILANARYALSSGRDVGSFLMSQHESRKKKYIEDVLPVANEIMEKSFSIAISNAKTLSKVMVRAESGTSFEDSDLVAIDIIRERTRDDQRRTLARRLIDGFVDAENGIDKVRSEEIMKVIEYGLMAGKTESAIAHSLRADYEVKFGYRVNTIVRTETLSAISEGQEWNHRVLKEVFDEVGKQWFHTGDAGINPEARKEHAAFEGDGIVPYDYVWTNSTTGGKMKYPRDPGAGPADICNCRCSWVSVIPQDARSKSDLIVNS